MTAPTQIPDTVTIDGAAAQDAVYLLGLVEGLLLHSYDADALVRFYPYPTDGDALAEWAGSTAAYLRRRLLGVPQ